MTVRDAYGNLASSYKGKVKFSSSDVQAVLPVDYQFTATDAGVHTFQVTLKTAQLQSITATDVSNTTIAGSVTGIDVLAGAATQFSLGVPSTIAANTAFALKVSVLDAWGNKVKNYAGTVHFGNTAGMVGMPADYTFSPSLDAGVHTFNITLSTAGTQTLSVADTLDPLLQSSLSVTIGTKVVTGGGSSGGGKRV